MLESPNEPSSPIQSIRRSVTLPTKLNPLAQRGSPSPKHPENVIFYHPSAKIVHFAPRALVPIRSSSAPSDFDYPVDTIETLPWRSATERTVATAPLRLEKGLTVFLKCGNVVHAILRNSQCWCVDGVSKFVLRIRPLTYYRIEIPYETEDDKAQVEELKLALPTVLRYEVTPCPFKRSFTVELPEEAMAPRRKKAWRPKERNSSVSLTPGSREGSPAAPRSERLDSVSTGEDTDGATTDDGALTPQRTNSTTASEALPADGQLPVSPVPSDLSPRKAPIRRSVTEMPQTFTSLVAKFDATPVPEEDPSEEIMSPGESEAKSPLQQESKPGNEHETQTEPETKHVSTPDVEQEFQRETESKPEHHAPLEPQVVPEPEPTLPAAGATNVDTSDEASHHHAPEIRLQPQFSSVSWNPINPVPEMKAEPEAIVHQKESQGPDHLPASGPEPEPESEPEPDHDTSFASSPESFHSAEFTSLPDSSSQTTPVESYETQQKELSHESTAPVVPSVANIHASRVPEPRLSSSSNISPEHSDPRGTETPISANSASHVVREDIPKPSLTIPIPSATTSRRPSSVKSTSPGTDFDQMSTEFRRRAQATRKRDTSPMPPPSAIYQPTPNQHADSLLSKALTLVLVPPVSLFIVLLHIAARIVASPAVNTTLGEPVSATQPSSKDPVPEDDFNFPLDRETSSEYEDARVSRKLDPWDLD